MPGPTDLQVFVRGLDKNTDEAAIKEKFSKFGQVTKVTMPRHFETKEPRGFAFVTYENHSECVRASKEMNGQDFSGSQLLVELAKNPKDSYQSSYGFHGRDERDRRPSQRAFGRGYRGGGRGYSSGYKISRDFDDDRYRSDDYSKHPGTATHHLVDGFRARRSPAPRNFGHREMRSSERDHVLDWSDSQVGYRNERPLRDDRRQQPSYRDNRFSNDYQANRNDFDYQSDRDHYSDRRQHGNVGGRSSPLASREQERHSTRNGGRRSPGVPQYPPNEASVRSLPPELSRINRNRDNSERRSTKSPSPPAKRMRIGEYSHEGPRQIPVESRYLQGAVRDPVQVERNRADAMKRRLPLLGTQPKRMRMEKPSYSSRFSGRDASFY